jgi:hypothetical protein
MADSQVSPPREVVAALTLMAVNVFFANSFRTLLVGTGILSGRIAGEDIVFKVIDEFVIWGFSIGFLVLLWYGLNWARWVNLVLSVLNIGLAVYRAADAIATRHYSALILPTSYIALETIALYLLFLSPGRFWFERRESPSVA